MYNITYNVHAFVREYTHTRVRVYYTLYNLLSCMTPTLLDKYTLCT